MRTRKFCSTVSYCSPEFIKLKLLELVAAHIIQFFVIIYHFKEDDEKKDHCHIYIEPNTLIDTMDIQQVLQHFDPAHPDKLIGTLPFRSSDPDDWLLYDLHDEDYLATKGEVRKYHYSLDDCITNDEDALQEMHRHAYYASDFAQNKMKAKLLADPKVSAADMVLSGQVPINQFLNVKALKEAIGNQTVYRAGRKTHTPIDEMFNDYLEVLGVDEAEANGLLQGQIDKIQDLKNKKITEDAFKGMSTSAI